MRRRSSAPTIAALILVLVVAALVPGARSAAAADTLDGAGESWPGPAIDKLRADAQAATSPFTIGFIDVGETTARAEVAAGDADFAVAGGGMSDSEKQTAASKNRTIAYAPYMAGAVAVVVALDVDDAHGGGRIQKLNLTVPTLTKLFTHGIDRWNDATIKAENPTAPLDFLRDSKVILVARKDTSSSTAALLSLFLADPDAKPIWNTYARSLGAPENTPLDAWPSDPHNAADLRTDGSKGVIDRMLGLDPATGNRRPDAVSHHIGYLAPSWAIQFSAPMATLMSKDGATKVDPTPEAVTKAMAKGTTDPATNLVALKYSVESDGAWPIPLISYLAVPTAGLTAAEATALSKFVKYALSDAGQQTVTDTKYVPISAALKTAGLKVADDVAAQPTAASTTTTVAGGATTTTTSSSTSSTTATTSASGSTFSATSTGAAVGATAGTAAAGVTSAITTAPAASSTPSVTVSAAVDLGTLAATGRNTLPVVAVAMLLVLGGEAARHRLRRPRRDR